MQGIRDYNDEKIFNLPSISEGSPSADSTNWIKNIEKKKSKKQNLNLLCAWQLFKIEFTLYL